jgi:hypothetical protein
MTGSTIRVLMSDPSRAKMGRRAVMMITLR